ASDSEIGGKSAAVSFGGLGEGLADVLRLRGFEVVIGGFRCEVTATCTYVYICKLLRSLHM
ncbi:MAG: hypothetical protein ACOVN2_06955, partial [Usitatibacteraceae bacterium]